MNRIEIECLFRLEEVIGHASQKIKVVETSAKTGQHLEEVAKWLQDHQKQGDSGTS